MSRGDDVDLLRGGCWFLLARPPVRGSLLQTPRVRSARPLFVASSTLALLHVANRGLGNLHGANGNSIAKPTGGVFFGFATHLPKRHWQK